MGRHSVARSRRKPSAAVAAVAAPYALLLAAGGDLNPLAMGGGDTTQPPDQIVDDVATSGVEIVAAGPMTGVSATPSSVESAVGAPVAQFATASRYRVYNREAERVLPIGIAPEKGLQVKTILVARSIHALFPEIQAIG